MDWSEKVMLRISRSLWSSWIHLWCFHCSNCSLSKVIAEKMLVTFQDLKWPWPHGERSLVVIFRLRASSLPVTRCLRVFRMAFFQKRHLSFSSIDSNGEVTKLTWPWVTDPWVTQFREIHFMDTGTDINRWKFQGDRAFGVAMTSIHLRFGSGEVTWRDLVAWPWVTWVWKFSQDVQKRCMNRYTKNVGASAPVFWDICEKKPEGGGGRKNAPLPSAARFNGKEKFSNFMA